jgi:hypothetical protein
MGFSSVLGAERGVPDAVAADTEEELEGEEEDELAAAAVALPRGLRASKD